ncbi:alpha/beta-hydrolase [Acaromyces ingoldii]|uniref:Alpha/beta-hydrolase n=1 Tax=Acaromyces ingoldii TaxID=215250 RepID=A0A316YXV6_9BASI|nr:alpha/beta-hydrolase [Acaromyces ingoldii]PWN93886.1 alpha/beta-hydrolase [Acaromyces ingoldii]
MGWIPSLWTTAQAVLSVFVLGVASTAGLLYRYQRSLVYPSNFPQGSRTDVLTPDHFGIPYEDLRLTTPDGETLHAFLMPQKTASEKEKARGENLDPDETVKRRPTILFLHANAGNMGHRLPLASVFYKRFGCNVLMLSYRGYGLSTGQPSEQGIRIDAQTALDWIRKHEALQKTVIVAYGQSIGGAVAVDLVSRNTKSIYALILENTFLSIPELIPHVLPPVRPFAFLCREYWPTGESIKLIPKTTPILFLSGRMDELVPPSHMDALLARCASDVKVWKSFAEGTHNDTCVKHGYFESIGLFLTTFIKDEKLDALRIIETGQGTSSRSRSHSGSRAKLARSASTGSSSSSDARRRKTTAATAQGERTHDSDAKWVEMSAKDAETAGPLT